MDSGTKAVDDLHRWEVEPHPYSNDYDYFVTDDDTEARAAILEAAEMYLWDGNEGEERTLRVKMNKEIAAAVNSINNHVERARRIYAPLESSRASVVAPQGDVWTSAVEVAKSALLRIGCSRNCYSEPDEAEGAAKYIVEAIKEAAGKHRTTEVETTEQSLRLAEQGWNRPAWCDWCDAWQYVAPDGEHHCGRVKVSVDGFDYEVDTAVAEALSKECAGNNSAVQQAASEIVEYLTDFNGRFEGPLDFAAIISKHLDATPVTAPVKKGEQPLCAVHRRLEDANALECEIGNDCVACSLNERRELLQLLAPFAAAGNTEDSVTVLRRVAEFYETHAGDGRVVVSYPAATSTTPDGKRDALVDEVELRMGYVVEAAVEWHQAGREGGEWLEAADKLGAAIDSLLELRDKPATTEVCGYCASPEHFQPAMPQAHFDGLWHRSELGGHYRCTAVAATEAGEQENTR